MQLWVGLELKQCVKTQVCVCIERRCSSFWRVNLLPTVRCTWLPAQAASPTLESRQTESPDEGPTHPEDTGKFSRMQKKNVHKTVWTSFHVGCGLGCGLGQIYLSSPMVLVTFQQDAPSFCYHPGVPCHLSQDVAVATASTCLQCPALNHRDIPITCQAHLLARFYSPAVFPSW